MMVEVEPGELDAPDLVEIGSSGETGTSVHSVRAYKQIP